MSEDLYTIHYQTDKDNILRTNVTKEQVDKFLASLTYAEKSSLRVTKNKNKEDKER